jgi:glycosyltransferase involved in cell wall biosynthesis
MFLDNKRQVIVITALTKWDEPPRMRHYVATHLSRFFNIIFCELNQKGGAKITHVSESLLVLKVGMYVPGLSRIKLLDRIFNSLQAFLIMRKINSYFLSQRMILLNFRYDFIDLYKYKNFIVKYLFINDDFINMNTSDTKEERNRKRQEQSAVINSCDRVFVSSDPLADDIRHLNKPISIIYSGHDFEPTENRERKCSTQIYVCFMGFIHDKLELSWIEMLALRSEVSVVLIGPIESKNIQLALSKYRNVTFHPPMVGKELQNYMSQFDVFIMPYTNEPVNSKATVPAKLFQYLACGKPVVSTLMNNLVALPEGFVYFASDGDEFIAQVFNAKYKDTPELRKMRIDYASNNGWEKRAIQMHEIIVDDIRCHTLV